MGPPAGISLMKHNSTSIQIMWGEVNCTKRNGNITDYRVIYGTHTTGAEDLGVVNVTNQYRLEVNGLYPLMEYIFKVAAIKDNEIGPYSIDSIQTSYPNSELIDTEFINIMNVL